ncbi:unnamed protein product [Ambrosiozyma monospora]|uniref:Unnamed protein product n=1 Tax=Ambrosiozyma monospora TaxID=43982 RepID=A0ACB5T1G8_AMBMO|nr:unnamed protein product [Ambrosiozyma monospora]
MSSNQGNSQNLKDYSQWSKEQLIERLKLLEGKSTTTGASSGVVSPSNDENQAAKNTQPLRKSKKKKKEFDFSKYTTRHIALRFAYLGWNYQGLAIQNQETELPTVESEILKALFKIKLIGSLEPQACNFSRCGRTDKGVSAMNQVISLTLRSKLSAEELTSSENDHKELDYIRILNQVLPSDIRFHSVCLRPPEDFDARFSCTYRHYKYFFNGNGLNVEKMREAASYYLGENDFRNFCKVDGGKQITVFKRGVLRSEISQLKDDDRFYVFDLKGTAFLWHQVRCMVAVLLSVGQGLEEPTIVKRLLDPVEFPSRPAYNMAHDIPLTLYDCGFNEDEVKWSYGDGKENLHHLEFNEL